MERVVEWENCEEEKVGDGRWIICKKRHEMQLSDKRWKSLIKTRGVRAKSLQSRREEKNLYKKCTLRKGQLKLIFIHIYFLSLCAFFVVVLLLHLDVLKYRFSYVHFTYPNINFVSRPLTLTQTNSIWLFLQMRNGEEKCIASNATMERETSTRKAEERGRLSTGEKIGTK